MTGEPAAAKRRVRAAIAALAPELVAFSHDLHHHPETAFGEHRASARLAARLARGGFDVVRGAFGVPTAVAADAGTGPRVVICCEYDALPGLGHACGHNVVAAAGLGAGLAVAPLAKALGGRITVLGTPAEEGRGGKVLLALRGAFAGARAAMLVHPAPYEAVRPHIIAAATADVTMLGRAAHASMYPERGVNALDAMVLGYLGVAALRQHLEPTAKVHGVLRTGGTTPSIVPERSTGVFMVRAADAEKLAAVRARLLDCLDAGALAAGARVLVRWRRPEYREMRHNLPLATAFERNLRALGRDPLPPHRIPLSRAASTDLGNVSHLVPAIHPKLAICPPDVVPHSAAFRRWSIGPAADRAVLDGAAALAMTIVDLWLDAGLRASVTAAFSRPGRSASRVPRAIRPAASATLDP